MKRLRLCEPEFWTDEAETEKTLHNCTYRQPVIRMFSGMMTSTPTGTQSSYYQQEFGHRVCKDVIQRGKKLDLQLGDGEEAVPI